MKRRLKNNGGKLNFTPAGAKTIVSSEPKRTIRKYNPLTPRVPRLTFA